MNRRLLGLVALGLALPVASGLAACESDSNTGPSTVPSPEAGDFDAPGSPDAPVAPVDSAVPSGAVSLTVKGNGGAPLNDVTVVFHDAAGAVIETKSTSGAGVAVSTGATPAMVSVLLKGNVDWRIVTWTGVEAGDALAMNLVATFANAGAYDVSLSAVFDGATTYVARTGDCASSVPPWTGVGSKTLNLRAECVGAKNGVVVQARDATSLLAYAFAKDVAAPGAAPVPVTVGAFAAPTPVAVSLSNVPGDTNGSFVNLDEIVGTVGFPNTNGDEEGSTTTFQTATGFAEALQGSAYVNLSEGSFQGMTRRVAAPAAAGALTFDFATALPRITNPTTTTTDPKRPELAWTHASPQTKADGGLVQIQWAFADTQFSWTFVVPPTASTVKAPALPAVADEYFPAGASFNDPVVVYFDADVVPSYAVFRRQAGTSFDATRIDTFPTLPATSAVSVSGYQAD